MTKEFIKSTMEYIYCKTLKRHYCTLQYFGGNGIRLSDFQVVAEMFAEETGVPLDSVSIDVIETSRRYKGFKYLYSDCKDQRPLDNNSFLVDNAWKFLTD